MQRPRMAAACSAAWCRTDVGAAIQDHRVVVPGDEIVQAAGRRSDPGTTAACRRTRSRGPSPGCGRGPAPAAAPRGPAGRRCSSRSGVVHGQVHALPGEGDPIRALVRVRVGVVRRRQDHAIPPVRIRALPLRADRRHGPCGATRRTSRLRACPGRDRVGASMSSATRRQAPATRPAARSRSRAGTAASAGAPWRDPPRRAAARGHRDRRTSGAQGRFMPST